MINDDCSLFTAYCSLIGRLGDSLVVIMFEIGIFYSNRVQDFHKSGDTVIERLLIIVFV